MPPRPLHIEEELLNGDFRISIFGSARIASADPIYQDTFNIAKVIGRWGVDLVTGGGPGLMEAASLGHKEGDKKNRAHCIGLNIVLPFEQKPNAGLEYLDNHELFSTRLDEFMLLSSAVVVMPGGIGTCLELFYTWQLLQVKHVARMPVILVGKMWRKLLDWVIDYPLGENYMDAKDLRPIVVVNNWKQAVRVLKEAKKRFDSGVSQGDHNWQQYGRKMKKLMSLMNEGRL